MVGGAGTGTGTGPDINLLPEHPYLAIKDGSEEARRCEKFRRMEIGGYRAVNWTTLEEGQEAARARDFISHDTPIFQLAYLPSYWLLVIEFLSSSVFTLRSANHPEEKEETLNTRGLRSVLDWERCALTCPCVSLPRTTASVCCWRRIPHYTPTACTLYPNRYSQILESDRSGSLWKVEVQGVLNYRSPVPLPA
ncbi:hypothetical protein Hdeb2414_s0002g00055751 [Helianthus debilis subsp. tardiflorus]